MINEEVHVGPESPYYRVGDTLGTVMEVPFDLINEKFYCVDLSSHLVFNITPEVIPRVVRYLYFIRCDDGVYFTDFTDLFNEYHLDRFEADPCYQFRAVPSVEVDQRLLRIFKGAWGPDCWSVLAWNQSRHYHVNGQSPAWQAHVLANPGELFSSLDKTFNFDEKAASFYRACKRKCLLRKSYYWSFESTDFAFHLEKNTRHCWMFTLIGCRKRKILPLFTGNL